ncbi:MAG: hypothetical protein Q4D07_04720 [Selenomonadaceae bacterium]|nr:hypothetical protein [Selenomonadaceae bacterium]
MNSKFFPQYLFNTDKMAEDNIRLLLKRAAKTEASLAVRAFRTCDIRAELFLELLPLSDKDAEAKLLEAKIVDEAGLAAIRTDNGDVGLNFLQILLDDGIYSPETLVELLAEFDNGPCPVSAVIEKEAGAEFEPETELFSRYVRSFVDSIDRFTGDIAIIAGAEGVNPIYALGIMPMEYNAVSQRIDGDQPFVAGVAATDEPFCGLASSYSGEDIPALNDMAVDSVSELLNVINGIYAVELARQHLEVDLEMPRSAQMPAAPQPQKLIVKVTANCGEMYLILAKEEYLPPITIF